MASSYNPPRVTKYSDKLKEANARQLAQLDQYQNALRQNDQRRVQKAGQGMKLVEAALDFSVTAKNKFDEQKKKKEEAEEATARASWERANLSDKEFIALKALNNAAKDDGIALDKFIAEIPDEARRQELRSLNPDHLIYFADFQAGNFALSVPALIEKNADIINYNNPELTIPEKHQLIRNFVSEKSIQAGIDDLRYVETVVPELDKATKSILKQSVKDGAELTELKLAAENEKRFANALGLNNLATVYDDYVQKQSASKGRTLGNLDGFEMLKTLAGNEDFTQEKFEAFLDTVKPHDGAKGGMAPLRNRFSKDQISEIEAEIANTYKAKLENIKTKNNNKFQTINNEAIENIRERDLAGEDPRALVRDLERLQGSNKQNFGKEDTRVNKMIEALKVSPDEVASQDAYFNELYEKGQLTSEMINDTENSKLIDTWLSRAQAQEKYRKGVDYSDSKKSVESLITSQSEIFKSSMGASGLSPKNNALRSELVNRFEKKLTTLVELEDPNAAVNAALYVETFWTKNGGGQVYETAQNQTLLFLKNKDGNFPNYFKSLSSNSITNTLKVEKQSIEAKADMAGGYKKALDEPLVYLNQAEVMEAIDSIQNGDGYSTKLKLVSGMYPTLGGPNEILKRQAAALEIDLPEPPKSIEQIYKEGNPFINCLINEKGIENLSTNQLLRQCRALDENFELPQRQ